MSTSNEQWVVQPGTDVFGSDGTKVGSVDTIEGDFLVLRKGFFFPKDHYIPFTAIAGHTDDRIDLNVTADEATNRDWDQVPSTNTATTTSSAYDRDATTTGYDTTVPATAATTSSDDTSRGTRSGASAPDDEVDMTPFEHRTGGVAHTEDDQDVYIPVVEEELTASTRGVERGAVRIETKVSEHEESLSVPVTEERVHVERVAVNREATAADMNRDGATIDVPVYGEEVDMQKRARVVEEVEISKDAVQETRQVTGTVRRDDVDIQDSTVSNADTASGTTTNDPSRRQRQ